ncbi:MAG TPA: hypothetical protein VLD37_02825 [Candidatus Bilamarchaeum sp.]|nr:hypothetical protein [Candidatus Bilamarchaeum sp.]
MAFRQTLALIMLIGFISASYADCIGYLDSFDVRVLDGKLRPIQNASITVRFDRGATFGEQYFTTQPKLTDSSGKVHFDIANQGTLSRKIDCNIEINATAGGELRTVIVKANEHGPVVDIQLNSTYPLDFYVRDQLRAPLGNASVTVGNKSGKTDSAGKIRFYFKTGDYNYLASYQNAQQSGTLTVSNDTEFEVLFPHYRISISVKDDNGAPLPATLMIFNDSFEMQGGTYENERTFGESIPYSVDYKGIIKEGVLYPATEPIADLTFDIHAPLIGQITPTTVNSRPRLTVMASDPGQYASGLDVSSMKVRYKIEPSDDSTPWSTATTFTAGKNTFNSEFPELPKNSIVRFMVEVKDKAGNRADLEGKFSTFAEQNPSNNTTNQSNPQPGGQPEQGIPLLYIIVGIIVLVLGVYMVIRMKSKVG